MKRMAVLFLILLNINIFSQNNEKTNKFSSFGRGENGDLKVGCYLAKDIIPEVNVNFVGGIEFKFIGIEDINKQAKEKGYAIRIPSNTKLYPDDVDDAMSRLEVSNFKLEDNVYEFHEQENVDDGFLLKWKDTNPPIRYVSMFISWTDLGNTGNMNSAIICFADSIGLVHSLKKDQIIKAQNLLISDKLLLGKADGFIGEQTISALRKYQEAHKLPITGEFDNTTIFFLDIF